MLSTHSSKTTRQVKKQGKTKLQISNDFKNRGPPPPIYYKPDQMIRETPMNKSDYLKVDIKMQPGEKESNMMSIYGPLF